MAGDVAAADVATGKVEDRSGRLGGDPAGTAEVHAVNAAVIAIAANPTGRAVGRRMSSASHDPDG